MTDDSRPVKYLGYAIGEIVLVVIGILIALQVNNWNERRKLVIQEHETLLLLKEELKFNVMTINTVLKFDKKILARGAEYLSNPNAFKSPDSIYWLTSLLNYGSIDINQYILNKVLDESDAKIVENKYLINELRELKQVFNQMDKILYYLDEFWNTNTAGFLIRTGLGKNMGSRPEKFKMAYQPDDVFTTTVSMQLSFISDYVEAAGKANELSQRMVKKLENLHLQD